MPYDERQERFYDTGADGRGITHQRFCIHSRAQDQKRYRDQHKERRDEPDRDDKVSVQRGGI